MGCHLHYSLVCNIKQLPYGCSIKNPLKSQVYFIPSANSVNEGIRVRDRGERERGRESYKEEWLLGRELEECKLKSHYRPSFRYLSRSFCIMSRCLATRPLNTEPD